MTVAAARPAAMANQRCRGRGSRAATSSRHSAATAACIRVYAGRAPLSPPPSDSYPMFRAAIFDVDGLLIDSERAIMRLWLRATADLDRPMTESDYLPTLGRAAKESAALLIERLGL